MGEAIELRGRPDILVNSDGITIDETALQLGDEDWCMVLAVDPSRAS